MASRPSLPGSGHALPVRRLVVFRRDLEGGRGEGSPAADLLESLDVEILRAADGPTQLDDADAVLFLGNVNWYPKARRQLSRMQPELRPRVVVWHWEPLPPPSGAAGTWPLLGVRELAKIVLRDKRANDVYTNYMRLRSVVRGGLVDALAVSTPSRVEFLAERGIQAEYIPLGWTPDHGSDLGLTRDIDVLFLGELRQSRRRRSVKWLRRRGVQATAVGDWSSPQYFGRSRTRIINRARIFLNLQRFPGEFSGLRLILGMSNKSLVVSEPMYRPGDFIPGKHFVSASLNEMPEVIRFYLENEDRRRTIVEEAYRFVTRSLTLEASVARVLRLCAGG